MGLKDSLWPAAQLPGWGLRGSSLRMLTQPHSAWAGHQTDVCVKRQSWGRLNMKCTAKAEFGKCV